MICGWCKLTPDLYTTPIGSHGSIYNWFSSNICQWVKFYIFRLFYKVTSHNLWPSFVTYDFMKKWRINELCLVPSRLQLFKWGEFYYFSPSYNLTSDDLWPHEHTKGPIFSNQTSTFQMRILLHFQSISTCPDDLWPHQQMRVPMLHLLPTLVKNHLSMWKLEPTVLNFFTTTDNSPQCDPYDIVSFLLTICCNKNQHIKYNGSTQNFSYRKPKWSWDACMARWWSILSHTGSILLFEMPYTNPAKQTYGFPICSYTTRKTVFAMAYM